MRSLMTLALLLSSGIAIGKFVPSGPELDLILREIGDYDLDLVGAAESDEEDLIFLQRRVPEGTSDTEACTDDCAGFKAWETGDEPTTSLETPDTTDDSGSSNFVSRVIRGFVNNSTTPQNSIALHSLSKRAAKDSDVCAKTKIDGNKHDEGPINLVSYSYPNLDAISKVNKHLPKYSPFSLTLE